MLRRTYYGSWVKLGNFGEGSGKQALLWIGGREDPQTESIHTHGLLGVSLNYLPTFKTWISENAGFPTSVRLEALRRQASTAVGQAGPPLSSPEALLASP